MSNITIDTEVDMVNNPPQYTNHPSGFQPIEIARYMDFDTGNAWKYLSRYLLKWNPAEDVDKAIFYIKDAIKNKTYLNVLPPPSVKTNVVNLMTKVISIEKEPAVREAFRLLACYFNVRGPFFMNEDEVVKGLEALKECLVDESMDSDMMNIAGSICDKLEDEEKACYFNVRGPFFMNEDEVVKGLEALKECLVDESMDSDMMNIAGSICDKLEDEEKAEAEAIANEYEGYEADESESEPSSGLQPKTDGAAMLVSD